MRWLRVPRAVARSVVAYIIGLKVGEMIPSIPFRLK
jgi:hypothetical protein